jgi:DNA-binding NarL/FixJ family response regulator
MMVRVLVVDDHRTWRDHIATVLRRRFGYEPAGHASDGLTAVREAERLRPDLIVMDVGLPALNGIEAARRILDAAPDTKILFLSEHNSADIAAAALGTGAFGYVLKSDAGRELVPAIRAVSEGQLFVGVRFTGQIFETGKTDRFREGARRHEVEICPDRASMLDGFARFALRALDRGSAAIVVTTRPGREVVYQRLKASGLDIDAAIEQGSCIWADVDQTLSTFMVNGWPDEGRFWKAAAALVTGAAGASTGGYPRVAACGECAPTLLRDGHSEAAIRLEQLWDCLARTYDVEIMCGYPADAAPGEGAGPAFHRICASHSAVHSL